MYICAASALDSLERGPASLWELAFCVNCFSDDVVFTFAADRFHHPPPPVLFLCSMCCCLYLSEILQSSLTTCFILLLLHMLSCNFFLLSNMDLAQIFCISLFLLFNTLTLIDLTHSVGFGFFTEMGPKHTSLG